MPRIVSGLPASTGTAPSCSTNHATARCRSSPTSRGVSPTGCSAKALAERGCKLTVMRTLLLVALVAVSACAPKVVLAPAVSAPRFPDFRAPVVPEDLAAMPAALNQSRGWAFLQSGDLKTAEREFSTALK